MAYTINTRKTQDGKWVGKVDTKAYGAGQTLHTTEAFVDRGAAYNAALAWRTEKSAANAAKRTGKEAAGMTCQCCGRKHLANTGVIAHHGYQRPGGGWQTASCWGARVMPFEVSRDRLGELLGYLEQHKTRLIDHRNAIEAETVSLPLSYSDYSAKADAYGRRPSIDIKVTRETFDAVRKEHADGFRRSIHHHDFDSVKEDALKYSDREIKNIKDEINFQQKRYDGWKKTHDWNRDLKTWIKA